MESGRQEGPIKGSDAEATLIAEGKPLLLKGCSPCKAFSLMQNANKGKRDPYVVNKELDEAKEHIRFFIKLYMMRLHGRRCFAHEHPAGDSQHPSGSHS